MSRQTIKTGTRLATLALATGAALSLAACEEHTYPSAAPQEGTAAPSSGDTALAGAPNTRPPEYAPPGYGPHSYAPPPSDYPPGVIVHPGSSGAPEIVTMAPIPNPPETPARRSWRHRLHHRYGPGAPGYVFHPYSHHHHHLHRGPSAWVFHPAPARPVAHRPAHGPTSAPAHPAAGAAQLTKPQAPPHGRHHRNGMDAATAAAAGGAPIASGAANTMGSNSVGGSEAERYGALQQGLQGLFASEAKLDVPGQMDANQAATVTLTLPADFAQAAQAEAAKDGIGQAATSLNITASLSGDGYTITPVDAQSLPLAVTTPTVFQWRVTPTGGARNPLKVSAKAQGAGDSHTLDLGTKTTGASGGGAGRLIGLGLLAILIFGAIIAFFTRRPRPRTAAASKPRATHTNGV